MDCSPARKVWEEKLAAILDDPETFTLQRKPRSTTPERESRQESDRKAYQRKVTAAFDGEDESKDADDADWWATSTNNSGSLGAVVQRVKAESQQRNEAVKSMNQLFHDTRKEARTSSKLVQELYDKLEEVSLHYNSLQEARDDDHASMLHIKTDITALERWKRQTSASLQNNRAITDELASVCETLRQRVEHIAKSCSANFARDQLQSIVAQMLDTTHVEFSAHLRDQSMRISRAEADAAFARTFIQDLPSQNRSSVGPTEHASASQEYREWVQNRLELIEAKLLQRIHNVETNATVSLMKETQHLDERLHDCQKQYVSLISKTFSMQPQQMQTLSYHYQHPQQFQGSQRPAATYAANASGAPPPPPPPPPPSQPLVVATNPELIQRIDQIDLQLAEHNSLLNILNKPQGNVDPPSTINEQIEGARESILKECKSHMEDMIRSETQNLHAIISEQKHQIETLQGRLDQYEEKKQDNIQNAQNLHEALATSNETLEGRIHEVKQSSETKISDLKQSLECKVSSLTEEIKAMSLTSKTSTVDLRVDQLMADVGKLVNDLKHINERMGRVERQCNTTQTLQRKANNEHQEALARAQERASGKTANSAGLIPEPITMPVSQAKPVTPSNPRTYSIPPTTGKPMASPVGSRTLSRENSSTKTPEQLEREARRQEELAAVRKRLEQFEAKWKQSQGSLGATATANAASPSLQQQNLQKRFQPPPPKTPPPPHAIKVQNVEGQRPSTAPHMKRTGAESSAQLDRIVRARKQDDEDGDAPSDADSDEDNDFARNSSGLAYGGASDNEGEEEEVSDSEASSNEAFRKPTTSMLISDDDEDDDRSRSNDFDEASDKQEDASKGDDKEEEENDDDEDEEEEDDDDDDDEEEEDESGTSASESNSEESDHELEQEDDHKEEDDGDEVEEESPATNSPPPVSPVAPVVKTLPKPPNGTVACQFCKRILPGKNTAALHEKVCDRRPAQCKQCNKLMPAPELRMHEKWCTATPAPTSSAVVNSESENGVDVEVKCEHCDEMFPANEMNSHRQNCDWLPSKCQFCSMVIIQRDVPKHEARCSKNTNRDASLGGRATSMLSQLNSGGAHFESWSTDQVIAWLRSIPGLAPATIASFKELQVDGNMLAEVTPLDLQTTLKINSALDRKQITFALEKLRSSHKEARDGASNVVNQLLGNIVPSSY